MELYQLRTFLAVAAERHLTRAAERVHTSAPAVSAQLKALEEELGVRLFDRTPRGMSLTAAGERLAEEARRTLDAAQGLRAAAAEIRGTVQGAVRMGMVSDPVRLRLGDVMVRLAERHPQVTLQLQQVLSLRAVDRLRRGELDCAYVFCQDESLEGLRVQRLSVVDIVPVVPARWAADGLPATLDDLASRPWVSNAPSCGMRGMLETLFRETGREPPDRAMADSEGAIRGMVASGLGAGLMRGDQARDAQRAGEVVVWDGWKAHTWLCFIAPPEGRGDAALRVTADVVREVWGTVP